MSEDQEHIIQEATAQVGAIEAAATESTNASTAAHDAADAATQTAQTAFKTVEGPLRKAIETTERSAALIDPINAQIEELNAHEYDAETSAKLLSLKARAEAAISTIQEAVKRVANAMPKYKSISAASADEVVAEMNNLHNYVPYGPIAFLKDVFVQVMVREDASKNAIIIDGVFNILVTSDLIINAGSHANKLSVEGLMKTAAPGVLNFLNRIKLEET